MPTTADTPRRPTITLPPRPNLDTFLSSAGIISPGPMTLVSSFFADDYSSFPASPSPSFSQLLAAANNESMPSPFFTVSPGFSPSAFLFSPHPQSPFGISHQQALAQVTAQAVVAQSQIDYQIKVTEEQEEEEEEAASNDGLEKKVAVAVSVVSVSDNKKFQQPSDDGYNWRKYGQKQVKGSEFPRSYYKCTHLSCLVKKKVGRASDGHISEIIYKGQHNHEKPLPNRRNNNNNNNSIDSNSESYGKSFSDCSSMLMLDHCESYDLGALDMREDEGDDIIQPNPKRRNIDVGVSEVHKTTVTEPKIIVQTRSEVDLLDDGYKWRKYGQKVVKGNPHPRSYYKCTSAGCNVRKHVERASMDPKAVITTYEGKHNHDVPSSRKSSHNTSKTHKVVLPEKIPVAGDLDFGNSNQSPIHLRLKEEHIS